MTLSPIPREKVFDVLKEQGRIDSFTRLAATFLQHFKDSRLSFPDIAPTGLVPTGTRGGRKRSLRYSVRSSNATKRRSGAPGRSISTT